MTRTKIVAALVLTAFTLLLAACGGGGSTQDEENAIREVNKKWLELIVAKDAKAVAELYAEDGAMLPANTPKAQGREAIGKVWEAMFKLPDLNLTFETERFVIAKSGDVAVDIGTYKFAAAGNVEIGKTVVTWVKKDGKWQVLTDMFSSDAPPAPAPIPASTVPADSGAVPGPAETGPAPTTTPATAPAQPTP